ncbi:MAG: Asp-tRNA(Asn)/Glu-tRNA(Gln) amidotransferase subunit GatA [Acidobacteria bacterium]|nr:Asp-tRNA(Asn)/Glu-tRNA(Gln) amidotransferase subunit GatA [Acidobacteriota bacterium]
MAWATPNSMREGLAAGDLSAEGLVQAGLARIQRLDGRLEAVLSTDAPRSLEQARIADARLAGGERGPVLGLPVVLKDNLHWKGTPCTSGSRILAGYRAPYDATVVARLLQAGAVPLAKANMDEFAMGSSGEFSAFGPARNPWDTARVPGGSSSGSAVSVAAGYAPFALGSDTGGSVRLPASFCNLTALRPTYGVLSRYGVTAMASSLDQVGPIARTAEDVAALLGVMAGADPLDATSVDLPRQEALWPLRAATLKGLRVGLPREYFGEGLEAGVREAIEGALQRFKDAGAELVEVDLPHTRYAIDAYYLVCTSEVSSNLSRFDGLRYGLSERVEGQTLAELMALTRNAGFGAEAKRRILLGTFCLSKGHYDAFYLKALKVRTLIRQDFLKAFEQVDVLATPVSPTVAFPLGAKLDDPLAMHLADVYAVGAPLAGLPALAFPAGFSAGLPVGMQLMGPALSDVRLLELVQAFQERTDYHLRTPEL